MMTRNFIFTTISVASRLLVSSLLFLLLARLWGPEYFGVFSFVFSVSALLMLTVDFGFSTFLLREIAADRDKASQLIAQGIRAKFALTAAMVPTAGIAALAFGTHTLPLGPFILLLTAALLLSFAEFFNAPLRAIGRYDLETLLATAGNTVHFLLAGGLAWGGGTPAQVAGAMVVSRLLYLIASWRTLCRSIPPIRWNQNATGVWTTLKQLWPYGLDGALTNVWVYIDVVVVRILFGAQIVGLYAAGQKTVLGIGALAPVVGNVMIPHLADKSHRNAPDTWRAAAFTGSLMASIGAFFAIPLIAFPYQVVSLLFGPDFSPTAEWLPWFGLILLVRYLAGAFGIILSAIGLQRKRVVGQILAILVYLALLSIVAIRNLSVQSALAALLAAMVAMGIAYAGYVLSAKRRDSTAPKRRPLH